jgi:hypothetical protein
VNLAIAVANIVSLADQITRAVRMANTQKKFQSIISQTRLKSLKDTANGLNLFENIDRDGILRRRQYYAAAISKIRVSNKIDLLQLRWV